LSIARFQLRTEINELPSEMEKCELLGKINKNNLREFEKDFELKLNLKNGMIGMF